MYKDYNLKNLAGHKKIGVMGGSFDPVHMGHLLAAESAAEAFGLDRVIFIPTGRAPHKPAGPGAGAKDRLNMTYLAVKGDKRFKVSQIEAERAETSYSADTAEKIRKFLDADARLFFIVGADTLPLIPQWKDYRKLLGLCFFIAVSRDGSACRVPPELEGRAAAAAMPLIGVSSTEIRARLQDGLSVRYMLPEEVLSYIAERNLYPARKLSLDALKNAVRGKMTERRFIHTLGVADSAVKLARRYGADCAKAELAALLHDCAKDMPHEEKFAACEKYGIALDDALRKQIDLAHSFIGAAIARTELGVDDAEILDAVSYHTTGRSGMTLLDKIVYVADCIDSYREPYPGLDEIRAWAFTDLDEAVLAGLRATIAVNDERGREIHRLSRDALSDLSSKTGG
ncbi:MAG: nicotinate-nucleotide adenylyltransferase [Clostridiales bacterium]|jgi:nicotinate-nucleotide adenylyltransferase|nr:nicotinate-nucleotide adenylyltransferase [Clostridiales bacterium]